MNKKSQTEFLNQLKETVRLHRDDFKFRKWEFSKVLKEKNFVIKVVSLGNPSHKDIKKALRLLTEWQSTHVLWKKIVKIEKALVKDGGSVTWHDKWIKTYDRIKNELKSKPESR